MKRSLIAAAALLVIVGGCSSGNETKPPADTSSPKPPADTSSASSEPASAPATRTLTFSPGRVGPVAVRMTKSEARATGLFDADVVEQTGCHGVKQLEWKAPYRGKIDVLTDDEGTITSMGVLSDTTIETDQGIHVGSTLAEVNAAYGDAVSPADVAGFDQSGVWINTGDEWLGLLLDDSFSDVGPASTVLFMEVTREHRPELIRSGC